MNMENSKKSPESVLKRGSQSHVTLGITKPALVLDETCIKEFDFGMSLMGRAKDVYAIPNLPCIISKEEDDQDDLSSDGESQKGDVANKADNNESDVDRVSESSFIHENDTAHKDVNNCKKGEVGSYSEDPFNIYGILDIQKNNVCNSCSDEPKFPPGFTPDNNDQEKNVEENIKDTTQRVQSLSNKLNDRCSNRGFSSQRSMNSHTQKSKDLQSVVHEGTWAPTPSKLFIISVYAPQESNERRDLWDYLRTFIDRWEGDTVIMGDFKEVRSEHERFGSTFNRQGAIAFNNFTSLECLIDLPLEGYAFTWAHKSALNRSKLDRYLISKGVLDLFQHLSALCLDRHLSDHRPILLRETNYDYGPSPFRKINIQQNLSKVDKLIDQGKRNDEILIKRITLLNDLQELNNRNAMKISQKAKIRWSIEGDKNSKYFHGIMNKKRSQLVIRGTLANGEWISEPHRVKNDFFTHFKKQFSPIQAPVGLTDGSSLWTSFIKAIFGNKRDLDTHKLIPRRSPWQDVILAIHSLQSKGDVALKVLYKRLYALEMCKSISMAKKMGHPSLSHSFRRMPIGGVEQRNYDLLCSKVTDLVLPNISDRWCWSLEGSQEFSVKSSRILIDKTILLKAEVPTRWLRVVPIKVSVHAWRVCLDKLPTRANLLLRGMDIPSIACPLCNSAVESSSHFFFACPLARQVWRKILICWELEDVAFNSYNEWLIWIVNIRLHKQLNVFLEDQKDVEFACKKMAIVPTTLAAFESLTFPLVQEVVLLADFQCKRCQDRVADIVSRLNGEADSVEISLMEKKVTITLTRKHPK
nr:RNA-directed DNA polymerase, eukaryota [Tanacetum cinerariifolium]